MASHNPPATPSDQTIRELFLRTRGLGHEQELARQRFVAALKGPDQAGALFEFEALLKGCAAFGDPRNLPGNRQRDSDMGHNYAEELAVVSEGIGRALSLSRQLLGTGETRAGFSRYLESLAPDVMTRSDVLRDQLAQTTPEEALTVMSQALDALLKVSKSTSKARVTKDLFSSIHTLLIREVGRNAYFNPLVPLEFRSEFDRIRIPAVLDALTESPAPAALRVLAIAYLSLFRCLRYLTLVDQYASHRERTPLCFLVLAVVRSDLRVLCRFLGEQAAANIALKFENQLLTVAASDMKARRAQLSEVAQRLVQLRGVLEAAANAIRVDTKLVFENDVPEIPETRLSPEATEALGAQMAVASAALRASLHHGVRSLTAELAPSAELSALGSPHATERNAAMRLRRDVWIFSRVVRAFLAKSEATDPQSENWERAEGFHFVEDFLAHFRAIGFQLVRAADYKHLGPLLEALERLRAHELIDPIRLGTAVSECQRLQTHLDNLFSEVNRRECLAGVPFDKKAAAQSLRMYLGNPGL